MAVGLTLTVLGCDGSYPGAGGACSGYLVDGGGVRVWLEAGHGTMANLQRHAALTDVDAVVLSHEHPDHWVDLEGFDVACRYRTDGRSVPVYAPASLRTRTYHDDMTPRLVWHDVADGDRVEIGRLALTFARTDHGPETLAVRVDGDGRSLGYSADSGPGWSLEALGPGLDLALCEATFQTQQEGMLPGHLSARQAGAIGREAGVARLVLTHLLPVLDPSRSRAEGSDGLGTAVEVARLGDRYEV